MKKWMLVIFPGLMLAAFLVAYSVESKHRQERERVQAEAAAREKHAKEQRDAALREQVMRDSERKALERQRAAEAKEAERLDRWEREGRAIAEEKRRAEDAANASAKQIAEMEINLLNLRNARESVNRDYIDTLKRAEAAKIQKRVLDLENRRLITMLDRRALEAARRYARR